MKVKLLRYTPAPQELVALAGKLCYSPATLDELAEGIAEHDQTKYLNKLIDMGHLSPIEHASFTFGIEGVSRAMLAQITRHRLASFSVQSQRYVVVDGEFEYVIPPIIKELGEAAVKTFQAQMKTISEWYAGWIFLLGKEGAEDARFVLPNAAATQMLVTMNARELMHFFEMRECNRAQWEIRAVADEMMRLAYAAAPELFSRAGCACMQGKPCPEGKMSCGQPRKAEEVR